MNRTIDVEFTDQILQNLYRTTFPPGQIRNFALTYWVLGGVAVTIAFLRGQIEGFVCLFAFVVLLLALIASAIRATRRIHKKNESAIGEFLIRKQKLTFTEDELLLENALTPPGSPGLPWNGITRIEFTRELVFLIFGKVAYFLPGTVIDAKLETFLLAKVELHGAEVFRDGRQIRPPVPERTPSQKLRRAVVFGAAWTLAICLPAGWYLAYTESGKPRPKRDSGIARPGDPLAITFRLQGGRWFHLTMDVVGGPEVMVSVCYDQVPTESGFEMNHDKSFDGGPTRHYDRKAVWPHDKPPIVVIESAGISEVVLEVREIDAP